MALVVEEVSTLSQSELEDELATLSAHLAAGMCRWLELVAELDRRGGFAEEGVGSLAEWLAWRCGLAPRSAREHVRVARSLSELPATHAAFARGELSYAKVRALTRVATRSSEQELLDAAAVYTAAQLERVVRAYRRLTLDEARHQQEAAYLSVFWSPDGSLELHGRLAPEDGALVLRALEAARDASWRGSAEPRPARQASNAEALVALADRALAREGRERSGGERYQVVLHADEAALAHDGEGGCELDDGSALAAETARRLACDASVVRGGRKTRSIPPPLRRALARRDRGCRFPGCENRRFLDGHHIEHWARGGETTAANLMLLCRRHHRAVHEGGYTVDHEGRFYYPWGGQLAPVPPLPRGDPDALVERNRHLEIGARTCKPGFGDPLHLDLAIEDMFAIERRAASQPSSSTISKRRRPPGASASITSPTLRPSSAAPIGDA